MTDGTVFVVDDDQAVRESLLMLIRSVGMPVATFSDAKDFLDRYDRQQRGCLVLDVRMPGMSGLEMQRHLKETGIDIPIIIITGHGDVPIAIRAMKDGALEFLEKPFSKQLLLEHIRRAIKVDGRRRAASAARKNIQSRIDSLTPRERQVMDLIVDGMASKQVAAELGISKKTVDIHRAHVMEKMQAESVAELVTQVVATRPEPFQH